MAYSFDRLLEVNIRIHNRLGRLIDKRDAFAFCGMTMHANRINNLAAHILRQSQCVHLLLKNYPI